MKNETYPQRCTMGVSLRDWRAMFAMHALLTVVGPNTQKLPTKRIAEAAYKVADAMEDARLQGLKDESAEEKEPA